MRRKNLLGIVCVGLSIKPVCGLSSVCQQTTPPIVSVMEEPGACQERDGAGRDMGGGRGYKPAVNHVGRHEKGREQTRCVVP